MTTASDILNFIDALVHRFRPERVVLFGSYAYGRPTGNSDVDVLVVMRHEGPGHRQAVRIRRAIPAPFPLDVIVRKPGEVEKRIGWNDFFLAEVMEKGLVLYAADDARVGEQGRRRLRRRLPAAAVA
jgi:predicted nucleotidyltransferase